MTDMQEPSGIESIKKEKLTDQIFYKLRELILSGQWPAGYKLPSEPELASQFGVSRMSLRMSLQKLQALGLIEVKVGSGTYVKDYSITDYLRETGYMFYRNSTPRDIVEFRTALESAGVELAIERYDQKQLEELKSRLDAFHDAVLKRDFDKITHTDIRFHEGIINMTGNYLFISTYGLCMELLYNYLQKGSQMTKILPENFDFKDEWHTKIYDAIKDKNVNAARQACYAAIEHSFDAWK